jgi:peptide chain release factor subunit 1
LIKELEAIRGRHTELVSVYIPAGYNIVDVANQLFQEKSTAANIKSKSTRKNVLTALEKIIQHLKLFRQTPENGLVIFCGNVSPTEGKEDVKLWSFEPPEKMNTKLYWCDQVFVLEPLKEMVKEREVYGLIVLDAREANIGLLAGKSIVQLKHIESTVPSKTVKGGMSSGRYDRLRENAVIEFLNKVGEVASNVLLQQENLKGVLVGGPGPVKERFLKENYLNYQIQNKVLGVKDTGYTGEYGLEELVKRSKDLLEKSAVVRERELLEKFFSELRKDGMVTYGLNEVREALDAGAVDTLLISEGFDWVHAKLKCDCGFAAEKDLPKKLIDKQVCSKCGKMLNVEESTELFDTIVDDAQGRGTKIEIISTETAEGIQFKELGGIGAFLRYKI